MFGVKVAESEEMPKDIRYKCSFLCKFCNKSQLNTINSLASVTLRYVTFYPATKRKSIQIFINSRLRGNVIHVVGVHLRGIAPAGQHSSEEMLPFWRVIETYDYFVTIHRQQRKLKIVTHEMPNDFSHRYGKGC